MKLQLEEIKRNNLIKRLSYKAESLFYIEKKNGEPPATMSALWDFAHKIIMEEADDVKILQEHYKKL